MNKNKEKTALKAEVETLNKKLRELTEEELTQVIGGFGPEQMAGSEEPVRNWPRG